MQSGSKRNFVFQPKIPKISYKKSFETVQGLVWWAVQHKLTFPGVWRYSTWEYNELNTILVCHFQLSWYELAFGKRPLMQSVSLPYLHPLSGCLVFFFGVCVWQFVHAQSQEMGFPTESQNGWGWKGPVEVIWLSPLLKQGHFQQVARTMSRQLFWTYSY